MFKRYLLTLTCIAISSTVSAGAYQDASPAPVKTTVLEDEKLVVYPDSLTSVPVSNTATNYIRCKNGPIQDRTFSEELPLIFKLSQTREKDIAFIKFQAREDESGLQYFSREAELYITCDNQIYGLILRPSQIRTQRIELNGGRQKEIKASQNTLKELPLEQFTVSLIDKVQYDKDLPGSYTITQPSEDAWVVITPTTRAKKIRSIKPDGIGLTVHEYLVETAMTSHLHEFDFVRPEISENIFAVRLGKHILPANGETRVFITEKTW